MSSPTWTQDALRSEVQPFEGEAWRLVEAQHRVSTLKLVDSLAEQELLENILEATKPPLPEECRQLDYLLSTPFRYRPYPQGSRFRRPGMTPGVWYGAEHPATAAAEMVFYRFWCFAESPATPFPDNAAEYTAIAVDLATSASIDLTAGALANDAALWAHLTDYQPCQAMAETTREIGVELIRYTSVRDPAHRSNFAVLTCRVFRSHEPIKRQTWRIRISRSGGQAICEYPLLRLEFPPDAFADDPRLAGMAWGRHQG